MSVNRREALVAAASGLAALGVASVRPQPAKAALDSSTPRVRKDVSGLDANSPDIVALRTAVALMKRGVDAAGVATPAGSGRRWEVQAAIHGTTEGGFGRCKHANWFFLPWHRLYLYHFEDIVRELSGNQEFALPYWDWTRTRTLPATFWGVGNALDNPARLGVSGSGRKVGLSAASRIEDQDYDRYFSQTVISRILNINDFETFGGGSVAKPQDSAFQGRLENGPHNRTHTWVGGDMGAGGSPYDPIFWLHHCNVDRLWAEWTRRHSGETPSDGGWLGTTFADFYGRDGLEVPAPNRKTVGDTLSVRGLGYEYDRRLGDGRLVVGAAPPREAVQVFSVERLKGGQMLTGAAAFTANPGKEFTGLVNAVADASPEAVRRTVRLRIGGVKPPADPETALDVYLNCQKLNPATPITDPSYVGTCTFFDHGRHAGHAGHNDELTFSFDLSPDLARLYGDRPLRADEQLQVGIVARKPARAGEAFSPAAITPISPDKVTIEVVGVKGGK